MIKHLKRSAVAPSQVRGLKLISSGSIPCFKSRTFTGAWIEIVMTAYLVLLAFVAPSQVRGLKFLSGYCEILSESRTFTGAWIEI